MPSNLKQGWDWGRLKVYLISSRYEDSSFEKASNKWKDRDLKKALTYRSKIATRIALKTQCILKIIDIYNYVNYYILCQKILTPHIIFTIYSKYNTYSI